MEHDCLCCGQKMNVPYAWCIDCTVDYVGELTFHCRGHDRNTRVALTTLTEANQ